MSKIYTCFICNSEFKNSQSLHSHKSKYHPNRSKDINHIEMNKKQEQEKIINDSDYDNTSNVKRVSEQSNSSRKNQ